MPRRPTCRGLSWRRCRRSAGSTRRRAPSTRPGSRTTGWTAGRGRRAAGRSTCRRRWRCRSGEWRSGRPSCWWLRRRWRLRWTAASGRTPAAGRGLGPVGLPVADLGLQVGVSLAQGVGGQRVLVAAVGVAVADAPGPAGVGVGGAAPGVVPGQQVVRAVLAGAGRAGGRVRAVADLLEVLVEEGVPQVVAHLRRPWPTVADTSAPLPCCLGPGVGPVGGLHGARVGVGGVGVLPLLGVGGVAREQVQVAVLAAVLEGVAGRLRNRLPHRLLRAALEGVDVGRTGRPTGPPRSRRRACRRSRRCCRRPASQCMP